MIKFMPIRYWKNISLALFITGLTFTLVGTFCIKGNLVVHWSDEGVPNNFAGKWVLWALVLLSAISMLTYNSFTKEKAYSAGFGGPVSPEMAGALSAGLTGIFSFVAVTLVVYSFYSEILVPIIGTVLIIAMLIVFPLIAYFRNRGNRDK